MRRANKRKEAIRRRVIEAALELFCEQGIEGTCLKKITAASGVKHGSLFYYFESKEQMVHEALIYALERALRRWKSAVGEDGSGFVAELRRHLNPRTRDNVAASCRLAALAGELGRQPEPVRREIGEKLDQIFRLLAARLPGQRVKSDRAEIIVICSAIIGALLLSRAVSTPEMVAEILSSAEKIVVGLVKQGLPTGIVPQGDLN